MKSANYIFEKKKNRETFIFLDLQLFNEKNICVHLYIYIYKNMLLSARSDSKHFQQNSSSRFPSYRVQIMSFSFYNTCIKRTTVFYHLPLPVISEALPRYRVSLLSESPTFHRFHTDLRPEFAQGFALPWFNRTLFNAAS